MGMIEMTELTGGEVLKISCCWNVTTMTLEELVDGILELYNKYVYCEGFRNREDAENFDEDAYEFVAGVLNREGAP